jgi:hypothetical protein
MKGLFLGCDHFCPDLSIHGASSPLRDSRPATARVAQSSLHPGQAILQRFELETLTPPNENVRCNALRLLAPCITRVGKLHARSFPYLETFIHPVSTTLSVVQQAGYGYIAIGWDEA